MKCLYKITVFTSVASILAITICLADEDKVLAITAWSSVGDGASKHYTDMQGNPLLIRADGSGSFYFITSLAAAASIPRGIFSGTIGIETILNEIKPYMLAKAPDEDIFFSVDMVSVQRSQLQNGLESMLLYEVRPGVIASPPQSGFIRFTDAEILKKVMQVAQKNFYTRNPERTHAIFIKRPPYPGIPEPPSVEEIRSSSYKYFTTPTPFILKPLSDLGKTSDAKLQAPTQSTQNQDPSSATVFKSDIPEDKSMHPSLLDTHGNIYLVFLTILLFITVVVVHFTKRKK